ncbi:hypothetical protein PYW08_004329 [Mythimna loreyi]|uniref:Uncharacterized protein n=1 Tax=Mythimna loreyi TaxID=667449 RepID=A0ACC2QQI8_9NEOP|nr:hypothetical protein PYW08_004329 [Mythimna loreyi]
MTERTSEKKTENSSFTNIIKPDVNLITSHGYFVGHDCHLPAEKISAWKIRSQGILLKLFNLTAVHAGDIRAINMHRSYAALCAEKFRHHQQYPFTIHPYSKLRFYIELTFVILLIAASFEIAFHYSSMDPKGNDYHNEIMIFYNVMVVLNIIANFFTGYIEGSSRKVAVLSKPKIALNYLQSWLIVDLLACTEGTYTPENPKYCSWLTVGKMWNQTRTVRLLFAFDRAVSMLTTNTNMNLVKKQGCMENFLVICWIFSKIFVVHYALKYTLTMFGKESASAQYYMMKKQLQTYMVQRNFPPRIKSKILKFYAIRFQSKYFEESRMLECVSGQLREDILMHTGRQLVRELDFLKQLPSSLLVQIAGKLRFVIFIAGDIIFKINTIGDCLYFIDKGTVAIYSDSAKEICHLEDGDYFGEIELIMKRPFRTASVVAVTNCELFRLDRAHFETTIAHYPTVYNNIKEVALRRFERTRVLDEHHKAELRTAGIKDQD